MPDKIPLLFSKPCVKILDLLSLTKLFKSNGEIRRIIKGGGVSLNEEKVTDEQIEVSVKEGNLLKIGKKNFYKITLKEENK